MLTVVLHCRIAFLSKIEAGLGLLSNAPNNKSARPYSRKEEIQGKIVAESNQ
jgi:hypothetical protein